MKLRSQQKEKQSLEKKLIYNDNNDKQRKDSYMAQISKFGTNYQQTLMTLPPGPALIPMNYVINMQKGSYLFVIFAMMCYFNNFSQGCWLYLVLHGSYGLFWILKDNLFPDPAWQTKVSFVGAIIITIFWPLLGYGGYLLCSRQTAPETQWPSNERIFTSIMIYVIGIVLMLGSDGQKYFTLKYKKGLISTGFFSWTRNPNYLGEILIYCSFTLLIQENIPWIILFCKWSTVFTLRMIMKDYSLSQKDGYQECLKHSWAFIPKVGGNTYFAIIFYINAIYIFSFVYNNGGIYDSLNKLQLIRK